MTSRCVPDFRAGEPEEKEGVHGPAGAQGRADGGGEQRVPQEDRGPGGLKQQPGQPDREAAGHRGQDPPAADDAPQQVRGAPSTFLLLY